MPDVSFGRVDNCTGEDLLVYGPKVEGAPPPHFDNALYRLPKGKRTPNFWDCDGFFVPKDRTACKKKDCAVTVPEAQTVKGPAAVKFHDFTFVVVDKSGVDYRSDEEPVKMWRRGENGPGNWNIPDVSAAQIGAFPEVPGHQDFECP